MTEAREDALPRLYTCDQVADYLGVSVRTVKRLIGSGKLPALRLGRALRVRHEDLLGLVQADKGEPRATESTSIDPTARRAPARVASRLDRPMIFELACSTAAPGKQPEPTAEAVALAPCRSPPGGLTFRASATALAHPARSRR